MAEDGVIIVGAGAAGLTTAYELVRLGYGGDIHILEASNRWGGRVEQVEFGGMKLDLGGSWLQAPPTALHDILDRPPRNTKLAEYEPGFSVFEHEKWDNTKSLRFGYQTFVGSTWYEFFEQNILPSVEDTITYDCEVDMVDYFDTDQAFVECTNGMVFTGKHVVLTPSVQVLNKIKFLPKLPTSVQDAIEKVEWSRGFKLLIEFSKDFFRNQFSIYMPQYWAFNEHNFYDVTYNQPQKDRPILGFIATDKYYDLYANMTEQEIVNETLRLLDHAFNCTDATDSYVSHVFKDWGKEPYIEGVWSWYDEWRHGPDDMDDRWVQLCSVLDELLNPIGDEGQLFLAGEAVAPDGDYALVSGAAMSGKTTACRIMGGTFEIGYHCVPPPTISPRPTTTSVPTFYPTMQPTLSPSTTFAPSASRSPSSIIPTVVGTTNGPTEGNAPPTEEDLITPGTLSSPTESSGSRSSTKMALLTSVMLSAVYLAKLLL